MDYNSSYQVIGKVHGVYAVCRVTDSRTVCTTPAQVTVGNKKGDSSAAIVRVAP